MAGKQALHAAKWIKYDEQAGGAVVMFNYTGKRTFVFLQEFNHSGVICKVNVVGSAPTIEPESMVHWHSGTCCVPEVPKFQ